MVPSPSTWEPSTLDPGQKDRLNQLDSLCQQFHDAHNLYYDELAAPEETEIASRYFNDKESDIFEYRKEVTNWILECEAIIYANGTGLLKLTPQLVS